MDSESSTKFIGSLTKFLQSLCNGYVEFDDGVELIGHIYLSVDAGKTGKTLNYFLNEKVCKNDNSVTFISNSFHAQPEKSKGKDGESRKEDGEVSDTGDNIPRSTNTGTASFRPQGSSRTGASPNQNRTGMTSGTKRPGSPLKGPPSHSQRRAPSPSSQRRFHSSGPRGTVGSPVSKTVPSSPSSSSQDNAPSPSPARKSRNETSQPTSNQSDNVNADNENEIPSNVLSINPTPEFASFLGSLTSDNQTSQDQHSPPETKPDTDVTFIKEEFVSEPSSCAQPGSSGQHSGRSGEDSSGLYPVMLHQNTSVFPGTSSGFHGYQGGASSTATSQQQGFPGSSQSDPFNPVPGTSQDGADPSGEDDQETVYMVSSEIPEVHYYLSGVAPSMQQGQHLPQDIQYIVADSEKSSSSSSSGTIAVNCDMPVVLSVAEPTHGSVSNVLSNVSDPLYGSSSFPEPCSSFSLPQGQGLSFPEPQPEVVDTKYGMSHFLMWSHDQGAFQSAPKKRGPGRPRKSDSRVRPYDARKSPDRLLAEQMQTGSMVSSHRGPRGPFRAHRNLLRSSRGALNPKVDSPNRSVVSPSRGISTTLLQGAIRSKESSSRKRGRGLGTVHGQRGRGFLSLKSMMAKRYNYKSDILGRGTRGSRIRGRGIARRGTGRSKPAVSGQNSKGQSTSESVQEGEAVRTFEGNTEKTGTSIQSALTEAYKVDKLGHSRRGSGTVMWGSRLQHRTGVVRRGVGRPRKHPGPSGRIAVAQTMSSEGQVKDSTVQSLDGKQESNSSERVLQEVKLSESDPVPESSTAFTQTEEEEDEEEEEEEGHRRKHMAAGHSRFSTQRIGALSGRGKSRIGASASHGRPLVTSILVKARGGLRKIGDGFMGTPRLQTVMGKSQEGAIAADSHSTGGREASTNLTAGRGNRPMHTLDEEVVVEGRGTSNKAIRSRGFRGRGLNRPVPTLRKEEDEKSHIESEAASEAKPYECSKCGKQYDYKAWYDRHVRSQICEEVFPDLDNEEQQEKIALNTGEVKKEKEMDHEESKSPSEAKPYECSKCGKQYDYKAWYDRHVRSQICEEVFPDLDNVEQQEKIALNTGEVKKEKEMDLEGSKCASEAKPYECAKCGKQYDYKAWYDRHVRSQVCEEVFIDLDKVEQQEEIAHASGEAKKEKEMDHEESSSASEAKPYECSKCGKRYDYKAWYDRHVRSQVCEEVFPDLDKVEQQEEIAHGSGEAKKEKEIDHEESSSASEAKPYECSNCGKRYDYKAWYDRHVRSQVCEEVFPDLDKVEQQEEIAHGSGEVKKEKEMDHEESSSASEAKPYECSKCGKRYDYKACYDRHVRVCEDSSSYRCILCDEVFFDLDKFKGHGLIEHGIGKEDVMMLEKK